MSQIRLIVSVTMVCLLALSGCEKEKLTRSLNVNENWSFSGTFETWGLESNTSGTITLTIAEGHYECSTNLPYNAGTGKNNSLINVSVDPFVSNVPPRLLYGKFVEHS